MQIGLVGKSNVGKSTFFKAVTLADVEISNRPFVTIKPNSGICYVKIDCVDKFFNTQCDPREGYCEKHKRFVPAEIIDVAGLVPGAHKGLGLGSEFLNDLNQADVLIHVIDVSGSVNSFGEPVEVGSYDPAEDIKFLEIELDMWYLSILKKGWEKLARFIKQENKEPHKILGKQLSGLKVDENMVKDSIEKLGLSEDTLAWKEEDLLKISRELRKKTKPMIVAANKADVKNSESNYNRLVKEFPEYIIFPCSAEAELALKEASKKDLIEYVPGESNFEIISEELSDNQKNALQFIKKNVLEKFGTTGIQEIINKAVLEVLGYIAVFPGAANNLKDKDGNTLPDCFLLKNGTTALDFAYKIHTDIGKNFIKAIDAKKKIPVSKDHVLKHLDVLEIKTNA